VVAVKTATNTTTTAAGRMLSDNKEDDDDEEDDDDDKEDSWRRHLPSARKSTASSEDSYSALLSVDCVECRIGDRIFRLTLPHSLTDRLRTDIVKSEFREVFASH